MDNSHHNLLFGIRKSVRYHDRRRSFFLTLHTLVMLVTLLTSSGYVVAFATEVAGRLPYWVNVTSMALVAFLVGLDVVVGFARKATIHNDLKRRFIQLEQQLELVRNNHTPEDIARLTNERLNIESDEPPVKHALNLICHNELMRAMGYKEEEQVKINWLQRKLAHFNVGELNIG